jgi:hypothetical protein
VLAFTDQSTHTYATHQECADKPLLLLLLLPICRIAGPVGLPLLSWLHSLLLQPQHKLLRLLAAYSEEVSTDNIGHCSGKTRSGYHHQQQQQQQGEAVAAAAVAECSPDCCSPEPMEIEEQSPTAAAAAAESGSQKATAAAAVATGAFDALRASSLRALAAYNALAVSITQQKVQALTWLLQQLQDSKKTPAAAAAACGQSATSSSSSSKVAAGPGVQQVLVAQQRIAWAGLLSGHQVPLLLLAHMTGNAQVVQVCGVIGWPCL